MPRKKVLSRKRNRQLAKTEIANFLRSSQINYSEAGAKETFNSTDNSNIIPCASDSDNQVLCDKTDSDNEFSFDSAQEPYSSSDDEETSATENLVNSLKDWYFQNNVNQKQFTSLLKILKTHKCFQDLPGDCRSLIKTKVVNEIAYVSPGNYYHFGFSDVVHKVISEYNLFDISLQLNVDDLPLFKSNNIQVWPILGFIIGISKFPFVIGIYCGSKKPLSPNDYLKYFVNEFNTLKRQLQNCGRKLHIHSFVCDAPARAFIKCIKGHTGYSGCDKCVAEGDHYNRRLVFTEVDAPLRTNVSFREHRDEGHHIDHSILEEIEDLDMVVDFPLDYMHLICLGATRKLICVWAKGKSGPHKLNSEKLIQLSDNLVQIAPNTVSEFQRRPRTIAELDRWKAVEFRQFLLYSGLVVLPEVINADSFLLFKCLSLAVRVLCSSSLNHELNAYANSLLLYFIKSCEELYGKEFISYNIHCLAHIAAEAKQLGILDNFSAFKFENKPGKIKKQVKTPNKPIEQIIRRTLEFDRHSVITQTPVLAKFEHDFGPVPDDYSGHQYRLIKLDSLLLRIFEENSCPRDCYCLTKDKKLFRLRNILGVDQTYRLFGDLLFEKEPLFTEPCASGVVNIWKFKLKC